MLHRTLLSFAILTASAIFVAAQANAKDETALKQLVDRLTTAQTEYDAAALDKLFTADYIEISPAGEFDPRAKVLTFYTPDAKAKMAGATVSVDETFPSIRVYGDVAVVIAEIAYMMSKDGTKHPGPKMIVTIVARSEKGAWKIASAHYTGVRPTTAVPTQAKSQ